MLLQTIFELGGNQKSDAFQAMKAKRIVHEKTIQKRKEIVDSGHRIVQAEVKSIARKEASRAASEELDLTVCLDYS